VEKRELTLDDLVLPRSGPSDLHAFKNVCEDYAKTHPWSHKAIQNDGPVGRDIYKGLSRLARSTLGPAKQCDLGLIAEALGIPFKGRLDKGRRTEALFAEFARVHPVVDGVQTYLPPVKVLREYGDVHRKAICLFGSYPAALEAWHPGSYAASALHHRKDFFNVEERKKFLHRARATLYALFRTHDFMSREQLRFHAPDVYALVGAAHRMNRFKTYNNFVEAHLPKRFRPPLKGDTTLMGTVGEIFSYASVYLDMAKNSLLTAIPSFPYYSDRLRVHAPNNPKSDQGHAFPDVGVLDLGEEIIYIREAKAGLSFELGRAEDVTKKYAVSNGERLYLLNGENQCMDDELKVVFDELHLHVRPKFIEEGIVTRRRGDSLLLDTDIRVRGIDYFMDRFSGEIKKEYALFTAAPLQYVRNGSLGRLEDVVLDTAPKSVREEVFLLRERQRKAGEEAFAASK
jgi:hypothetical protein